MAMVNCTKCDYAFEESEKFCPRCDALYVKDAYVKTGPVSGLPHADKPTKSSLPRQLDKPQFKPTKERYNYGPKPNQVPNVRDSSVAANQPVEYKKKYGKFLLLLVILIIIAVVYNVYFK